MKLANALLATTLALGLFMGGTAALADEDVKMEQLPKKVQETVKAAGGAGEIEEIEKEVKDGRVVYQVEYKSNGQEYEMKVAEDGRVLEKKKD